MSRPRTRPLAGTLVAIVLTLASAASALASGSPPTRDAVYPLCGLVTGTLGGADSMLLVRGAGVVQPLADAGNIASVSPGSLGAYYSTASIELVEWDPLRLVPDAGSVALRTGRYGASELRYRWTEFRFDPPIVTRQAPHLAEPGPRTIAFRWRNDYFSTGGEQWMGWSPAGHPAVPTAFAMPAGVSGVYPPLPGSHPVVNHTACNGDFALQVLLIAQCVRSADAVLGAQHDVVVQRFRLPSAVQLSWLELSLPAFGNDGGAIPGTIELYDASGQATPPAVFGEPLARADFSTASRSSPGWISHAEFDQHPLLAAEQDYWLAVRTRRECPLNAKVLDGTQSVDFASRIGPLFGSEGAGLGWAAIPDRALDFRLIGAPVDPAGAPIAGPRDGVLGVSPNPARHEASFAWSGATGSVRFEVFDARGRRVGQGATDSAARTSWRWTIRGAGGNSLSAGVYFVRAVDAAGRRAQARFVVVR